MSDNLKIWMNGEIVPWQNAQVHLMTHALHYGSSVFEGIRAYDSHKGTVIFRLKEHIERLFYSASVYHMTIPWSFDDIMSACHQAVAVNRLEQGYLRPIIWKGMNGLSLHSGPQTKIESAVIAMEWNNFLGESAQNNGIRACVCSWNRLAPNTMPAGVKAGGNYMSSQLITDEAHRNGYDEGIGLSSGGMLSEGAGENLFFVRKGVLYTPHGGASILGGITRDTVIELAGTLGIEVVEQDLPREFMYAADEMFMTGTAAEITPVASVDDITVGSGGRGPITEQLQKSFFGLFTGATEDRWGWLESLQTSAMEKDNATIVTV
jgi:branched-chain amino acid aminotransferase